MWCVPAHSSREIGRDVHMGDDRETGSPHAPEELALRALTRLPASSECSGDVMAMGRSNAGHNLHVSAQTAADRAPCGSGAGGLVVWWRSERPSERTSERASERAIHDCMRCLRLYIDYMSIHISHHA